MLALFYQNIKSNLHLGLGVLERSVGYCIEYTLGGLSK